MPYDTENRRPPVPPQTPAVVNVKNPTAAMIKALTTGDVWALSMLLVRGCHVNMVLVGRDVEGTTPLMFLVERTERMCVAHIDSIRFLILEGCIVDAVNGNGETACIIASRNGHAEAVECLAAMGCNVNKFNRVHMNSLAYASQNGHVSVLQVLKDHGADVYAANGENVEPAMIAAKNGQNRALGWFDAVGRVRLSAEHFKALARGSLSGD